MADRNGESQLDTKKIVTYLSTHKYNNIAKIVPIDESIEEHFEVKPDQAEFFLN